MRLHFRNMHNKDTILIQEEVPLPKCNKCGIFVNRANCNQHQEAKAFKEDTKFLKDCVDSKENQKTAAETVFTVKADQSRR